MRNAATYLIAALATTFAIAACGSTDPFASDSTSTPTATSQSDTPTATARPDETIEPSPTGGATTTSQPAAPTPPAVTSNQPIPQVGDVAPDFTLPSANSDDVTLSELTAEQPVVLVFYRAFW